MRSIQNHSAICAVCPDRNGQENSGMPDDMPRSRLSVVTSACLSVSILCQAPWQTIARCHQAYRSPFVLRSSPSTILGTTARDDQAYLLGCRENTGHPHREIRRDKSIDQDATCGFWLASKLRFALFPSFRQHAAPIAIT